jgi:hypothetical protein
MDDSNTSMQQISPLPDISPSTPKLCPYCHQVITVSDIFCPHCGKELIENMSKGKQIWIYCISFLAPPLGLVYFFRYMKKDNLLLRRVGIIALVLTVLSVLLTIWWGVGFYNSLQQQLKNYQSLGY